jgi:hypothetical protein
MTTTSGVTLPLASRSTRYGLVAIVACAILVGSVIDPPSAGPTPAAAGPLGFVGLDKWLHALAYAGFAGTLTYALAPWTIPADGPTRPSSTVAAGLAAVVVLAAGYGFGVELVQGTLPVRSFDLADAAANAVGALLATAGWGALTLGGRLRVRATG